MTVAWTRHRFSGGVLALDVTNTVVLRGDRERSFDRFDDAGEIARFAAAASGFCAVELGQQSLVVADPEMVRPIVLSIRESCDALFRDASASQGLKTRLVAPFLRACADGLGDHDIMLGQAGGATGPLPFATALAVSALSLLDDNRRRHIRICSNCRWLFLDRSRNGSRVWCDMTVCGNRQKARRHYQRQRGEGVENA